MKGVYLIHLEKKLNDNRPAQHYLGYADDIDGRFELHKKGEGARLTAVAVERGIKLRLARIWPDHTRFHERSLKNSKHQNQLCPICNPKANQKGIFPDMVPHHYKTGRLRISYTIKRFLDNWIYKKPNGGQINTTIGIAVGIDPIQFRRALDTQSIQKNYCVESVGRGWFRIRRVK